MGRPSNWMKEVTGRLPMRSPGAPSHPRVEEREFWALINTGMLPTEAGVMIGVAPALSGLLSSPPPGLCVVAAGRAGELSSMYSHWSKAIRKARCGVLLQPDVDYDGDLLGVKIPRQAPVALSAGRGYACVAGEATLVQTLSPDRN